ncbi:NUDIX domain-containing protein [Streptomyces cyslabdanicus]|uniref:NUDIX domain-containing protein n=1 Tax=Streptomyces cyslabdanicus TaxID=1470456 RepID=UPI004043B230
MAPRFTVPGEVGQDFQGLEEAVLREVAEETGLLTATVVRQLAVEDKPHPDMGDIGEHLAAYGLAATQAGLRTYIGLALAGYGCRPPRI